MFFEFVIIKITICLLASGFFVHKRRKDQFTKSAQTFEGACKCCFNGMMVVVVVVVMILMTMMMMMMMKVVVVVVMMMMIVTTLF